MEFYCYSPFETFVVLGLPINLLGAMMACFNNGGRIKNKKKTSHISSDFKEKSESSLQRRRNIRNRE